MSVFRGSIAEYPGVVVDNFTNCERGRAFFLSHCHKDHMTGLGSSSIFNTLQQRNTNLYCSEVTQSLLLKDPSFTQLAPFLKGLPMEQPVSITLDPSADAPPLNFTVTLLPAGHCPGSAMFFFQGEKGNVLYTGDFRLTLEETKRLRPLHCDNRLLDITSLYLDTTFCHPIATKIPPRDVSRDLVVNQIDSWLSQDPTNVVHLQCGMFGYEHIFMALARRFNTKIHIATWKINAYSELPSVAECLTEDGGSTRIHCCNFRKRIKRRVGLPCGSFTRYGRPPKVLTVRPSTMWFLSSTKNLKEPFVFMPECNFFRVLHSMHASYSELCDFVSYLKPRRIVPCVVPVGDSSLSDAHARLKLLLPQSEVQPEVPTQQQLPELKVTVNHTRQSRRRLRDINYCNSETVTEERGDCVIAEDFHSDSCSSSDDTIDEFISSEDVSQSNARTFSRSTDKALLGPKLLGLPSMLATQYRSAIGFTTSTLVTKISSETGHVSETSSVRSSESVTVGSLEQTSLELSEDSATEDSTVPVAVGGATTAVVEKYCQIGDRTEAIERRESSGKLEACCGEESGVLRQPSLDISLEDSLPSRFDSKHKGRTSERDKSAWSGMESKEQLSGEAEWHLELECSSDEPVLVVGDDNRSVCQTEDGELETISGLCGEQLTPKTGESTARPPSAKRHKTSRERKSKSARRSRHHHRGHHGHHGDHEHRHHHREHTHHYRDHADLSTPVGDMVAAASPRKLFHESKSEKEGQKQQRNIKCKRSKYERDSKKFKETEIIDLTQDDDDKEKAVVTGINATDVIDNSAQKGKSLISQDHPHPSYHSKHTDHQMSIKTTNDNVHVHMEPVFKDSITEPELDNEADSDITFCEEGSEIYSNASDVLGSPFYLPPTPGRENVASILERKSIAFSD